MDACKILGNVTLYLWLPTYKIALHESSPPSPSLLLLSPPSSPPSSPPPLLLPQDPKRHLEEKVDAVLTANITQSLVAMLDTVVFS